MDDSLYPIEVCSPVLPFFSKRTYRTLSSFSSDEQEALLSGRIVTHCFANYPDIASLKFRIDPNVFPWASIPEERWQLLIDSCTPPNKNKYAYEILYWDVDTGFWFTIPEHLEAFSHDDRQRLLQGERIRGLDGCEYRLVRTAKN